MDRAPSLDDPEWMGACNRERILEAMASDTFAGESCHAERTLCEPRPNA